MGNISEIEMRKTWRGLLQKYLGAPVKPVTTKLLPHAGDRKDIVECGGHIFAVECKARADTASVAAALEQMRSDLIGIRRKVYPLLVVQQMGEVGRALCERAGVDWLDLAGNARITHVQGVLVVIEGKKPASRPRGRKNNIFAKKSSRVAHWLLLHQNQAHSQQELVEATGLDKGHLSRILSRMEELRLIAREDREVRLVKPAIMLDAWRDAFEPPCGTILKGVVPSRSGEETVEIIGEALRAAKCRHVASGLASAWAWDGFADFRITTFYLDDIASPELLRRLDFVETERGANVWFMQAADEVAFMGAEKRRGNWLASPWFTYVDLAIHPERSKEAAEHLREQHLGVEAIIGS